MIPGVDSCCSPRPSKSVTAAFVSLSLLMVIIGVGVFLQGPKSCISRIHTLASYLGSFKQRIAVSGGIGALLLMVGVIGLFILRKKSYNREPLVQQQPPVPSYEAHPPETTNVSHRMDPVLSTVTHEPLKCILKIKPGTYFCTSYKNNSKGQSNASIDIPHPVYRYIDQEGTLGLLMTQKTFSNLREISHGGAFGKEGKGYEKIAWEDRFASLGLIRGEELIFVKKIPFQVTTAPFFIRNDGIENNTWSVDRYPFDSVTDTSSLSQEAQALCTCIMEINPPTSRQGLKIRIDFPEGSSIHYLKGDDGKLYPCITIAHFCENMDDYDNNPGILDPLIADLQKQGIGALWIPIHHVILLGSAPLGVNREERELTPQIFADQLLSRQEFIGCIKRFAIEGQDTDLWVQHYKAAFGSKKDAPQ